MNHHFNLADLFELVADAVPADREALVVGDRRYTYRELEERSNRLAHYLAQRGIGAGDHIGLYLYNCSEYLEGMLACFKLRAVPININYRFVLDELYYMFDNADLRGAIHGREFIPNLLDLRDRFGSSPPLLIAVEDGSDEPLDELGVVEYESVLAAADAHRNFAERNDEDLFILYTGGTTGQPKGVMWPHKDLIMGCFNGLGLYPGEQPISNPEEAAERAANGFHMRSLPLAPMMHGACWWYSCITLLQGNTLVINSHRSLDGEQVWDLVEQEKVNGISFVGDAMAIPLLDALRAHPDRWELSSVLSIGSGGAVFSESVQRGLAEFVPQAMLTNTFGSSETGNQGADDGSELSAGLGRIERSERADVITEDDRFVVPGSGEMGYLARSGWLALGYYKDPEKTARSFRKVGGKRWVLTGDLATVDKDGGIVVFGRGSNCINSGGEKIFPEEVEEAIKSHPAVFDVLVVAAEDPRFTERVAAVVQLREGEQLSLAALQQQCRKHVAGYKVPRELHLTDHIHRTPSGKPGYAWASEIVRSGSHLAESLPIS